MTSPPVVTVSTTVTSSSMNTPTSGFDFAAASAKITTNYVELTQLPINSILGALWAKKVILPRQKEEIEAIPLQSNRMEYLIDSVINPSLNVIKFKGLLEVMEQSEDVMFKSMAQNLVALHQSLARAVEAGDHKISTGQDTL